MILCMLMFDPVFVGEGRGRVAKYCGRLIFKNGGFVQDVRGSRAWYPVEKRQQNYSSYSRSVSLLADCGLDRKPDPSPAGSSSPTSCRPTHFESVRWGGRVRHQH